MTPRSANIYVTPQLHRWLHWLAEVSDSGTADNFAESVLRSAILRNHPDIDRIEAEYQAARGKLNKDAMAKLKPTYQPDENDVPTP